MDKTLKSQSRQAFWQDHLKAWSDSGLRQTDYCRTHNLSPHQFSYWKHKTQGKSGLPASKSPGFVRAHHAHPNHKGADLFIALPNGLIVYGVDQNNLSTVAQLINALS